MTANHLPPRAYLYLHGFASSPASAKAKFLRDRFQSLGVPLICPDLNQGNFFHLTLTRQLQQVQAIVDHSLTPAPGSDPTPALTVIGSSFGGLTAAWLAEHHPRIDRLILLAPAFGFLQHWMPKLGPQLQAWQTTGSLLTYHYGEQQQMPIGYGFVTDLQQYDDAHLQRSVPTVILHGRLDEVIPVTASRTFAQTRPWVRLIELDSDHGLGNCQDQIWQVIRSQEFPYSDRKN